MNQQPITAQNLDLPLYSINEIFYSLQGEGPLVGCPVIFVRLAHCNLRCTWCDTEYQEEMKMSEREILLHLLINHPDTGVVVISGGEPFVQNLVPLVNLLLSEGYLVQIETNGTLSNPDFPFEHEGLSIVCSPKTGHIHTDINKHCLHFKYVVSWSDLKSDNGLPLASTQEGAKRPPIAVYKHDSKCIWIMPLDNSEENRKAAATIALHFGYRYSPRLHIDLNLK